MQRISGNSMPEAFGLSPLIFRGGTELPGQNIDALPIRPGLLINSRFELPCAWFPGLGNTRRQRLVQIIVFGKHSEFRDKHDVTPGLL